ncbi:hypothetical protein BC832DRAFT_4742 [Gaertneriomyces semiglobifer]|nr:hypothetical protein BC832DRAFT_4742 [Gaertneriomyces semiglobifer]
MTLLRTSKNGDIEGALDLLRGCIHECDKILRIKDGVIPAPKDEREDGEDGPSSSTSQPNLDAPIPPEFYLVYGNALFQLGVLTAGSEEGEESLMDYLNAAAERLERGLERALEDGLPEPLAVKTSLGRILLQKASLMLEGSVDMATAESAKLAAQAETLLMVDFSRLDESDRNPLLLESAAAAQRYADMVPQLEGRKKWNEFAQELFKQVSGASMEASIGLGSCELSIANYYAERAEEGGDLDKGLIREPLERALKHFDTARNLDDPDKPHVPLLCLVGETYVNLGNVFDDTEGNDGPSESESLSEGYYKKAIECFRRAQKFDADALPSHFAEFVDEWEQDLL